MSYNGIGLTTARGTGTNGYIQRNLSTVRHNRNLTHYKSLDDVDKLESRYSLISIIFFNKVLLGGHFFWFLPLGKEGYFHARLLVFCPFYLFLGPKKGQKISKMGKIRQK